MKNHFTILASILFVFSATSQIPVTAVDTSRSSALSSFTYTQASSTYKWGVSPNNTVVSLDSFTAGGIGYNYGASLPGKVVLRRVDNAARSGNYTLEWVQQSVTGLTFNLFTDYQNSLDTFLTGNTYNKGVDNLFNNTAPNANNVERLDWIMTNSYSSPLPGQTGFAIFDRGTAGVFDGFVIAAITSLDGSGDPFTYGNPVRITGADFGNPGIAFNYRILAGPYPSNLLVAGTGTESIGGVFVTLQSLGIVAGTPVYGYSLFGNDLPVTATPGDIVDYTNVANFPITTSAALGGLDLAALTGLFIDNTIVLPLSFLSFNVVGNNDVINLRWDVENESPYHMYDIERSADGTQFIKIHQIKAGGNPGGADSYIVTDNVSSVTSTLLYYRIKQYEPGGSYHYSKTVFVKRNKPTATVSIFPNPVREDLYINITGNQNERAVITIFNTVGSQVIKQEEQLRHGNNFLTVNGIKQLSAGIYHLSVKWLKSGKTFIKQFSKE